MLMVAAWVGCGHEAIAQSGGSGRAFREAQWKTIVEIAKWKGPNDERQRKTIALMDQFGKNYDADSDIVFLYRSLLKNDPHAIDAVLPRFAPVLRNSTDERSLCLYLGMLNMAAELPPSVVSEADAVFRRTASGPYVKPRTAAIVLRAHPERADLLQWFDGQSALSTERELLNAAYAIGSVGKIAMPESKRLAALLKDSRSTVRVIAAEAYWRATHDFSTVVPVLRSALHDEPREFDLFSRYLSEQTDWTQTSEAVRCLGEIGTDSTAAADDIAALTLKSNKIDPRQLKYGIKNKIDADLVIESIGALTKIGARSTAISDAIETFSHDEDNAIADAAKTAIATLK
jgi:hypothetical protein